MAENKVCTTLSTDSDALERLGNFGNCQSYDIHTFGHFADGNCITSPNLHARNKSDAAGSAFAISYTVCPSACNSGPGGLIIVIE
jgi:hypothetical protein